MRPTSPFEFETSALALSGLLTIDENVNFDGGDVAECRRGAGVVTAVVDRGLCHHQVAQRLRVFSFEAGNALRDLNSGSNEVVDRLEKKSKQNILKHFFRF